MSRRSGSRYVLLHSAPTRVVFGHSRQPLTTLEYNNQTGAPGWFIHKSTNEVLAFLEAKQAGAILSGASSAFWVVRHPTAADFEWESAVTVGATCGGCAGDTPSIFWDASAAACQAATPPCEPASLELAALTTTSDRVCADCGAECDAGSYESRPCTASRPRQCARCDVDCRGGECDGPGPQSCVTCGGGAWLYDSGCVNVCPAGTRASFATRECLEAGVGDASKCPPGLVRTVDSVAGESCQPCHGSCLECDSISAKSCTSCPGEQVTGRSRLGTNAVFAADHTTRA